MKMPFACPSCAAEGYVDEASIGKQARCKHCGHRFAIPGPGAPATEVYAMDEPVQRTAGLDSTSWSPGSVYVTAPGSEPRAGASPRKRKPPESEWTSRPPRQLKTSFSSWAWLARCVAVFVLLLAAVALFAPRGLLIAGGTLVSLGGVMVIVGFAAGAYGAFREDFIYGALYLLVPLYTAYYIVTRWDDLWPWFACSTAGVALVLLGAEVIRWAGAVT